MPSKRGAQPKGDHWRIVHQLPNRSGAKCWECECLHCADTNRELGFPVKRYALTTSQINSDNNKCDCRKVGQRSVVLTFDNLTKTLAEWVSVYPCINKDSAKAAFYKRARGVGRYARYTDGQVLFGKTGLPPTITSGDRERIEAVRSAKASNARIEDICEAFGRKVQKDLFQVMADNILPLLIKGAFAKSDDNSIAGEHYEIQATLLPIGLALDSGVSTDEVISHLRLEEFAGIGEKTSRLSPFIVIDTSDPHRITDTEIQALFSTVKLADL